MLYQNKPNPFDLPAVSATGISSGFSYKHQSHALHLTSHQTAFTSPTGAHLEMKK